jgi:hypothetical protein
MEFKTSINAQLSAIEAIKSATEKLSQNKEKYIMEQLSEFVNRGLIVVEQTGMKLHAMERYDHSRQVEITMEQDIRLVLKDQEYIEKLEKEVEELKLFIKENL